MKFRPTANRAVSVDSLTVEGSPARPLTSADFRSFQFRQLTNALVSFADGWDDGDKVGNVSVSQISRQDIEEARAYQRFQSDLSDRQPHLLELNLSDDILDLLADPDERARLKAAGPRTLIAVETINHLLDYAAANGLAPHTLVRGVLDLPKATASRWIATARELRTEHADE